MSTTLRVLWKHYHFEWDHFYVWVKWIPLNCQNMRSNLNFVSFYFLWPDFALASLARPLYPGLMVPGYRQVSGRRKDLFCSSGYLSQGMLGVCVCVLGGGSTTYLWDWSNHSRWTRIRSPTLTSCYTRCAHITSPSIITPSTLALNQHN